MDLGDAAPDDELDGPLMSIGMFSRASLLSVKALRSYHQQGILVPASVDRWTGYRAYHPGQLTDASVLRRLRELDLGLAAIKEILLARDPEVTRSVLAAHEAEMRERLERTEHIVGELHRASARPSLETPVHIRSSAHQHVLAVSGEVPSKDFASFLGGAYPRLFSAVAMGGFEIAGSTGALYAPEVHDHDSEPVTAYVPIAEPRPVPDGSGVEVIELPAEHHAVLVHKGSYETVGDTYAALGSWVAYNASPSERPVREIYRVSYPEGVDPSEFETDICWPIEEKP